MDYRRFLVGVFDDHAAVELPDILFHCQQYLLDQPDGYAGLLAHLRVSRTAATARSDRRATGDRGISVACPRTDPAADPLLRPRHGNRRTRRSRPGPACQRAGARRGRHRQDHADPRRRLASGRCLTLPQPNLVRAAGDRLRTPPPCAPLSSWRWAATPADPAAFELISGALARGARAAAARQPGDALGGRYCPRSRTRCAGWPRCPILALLASLRGTVPPASPAWSPRYRSCPAGRPGARPVPRIRRARSGRTIRTSRRSCANWAACLWRSNWWRSAPRRTIASPSCGRNGSAAALPSRAIRTSRRTAAPPCCGRSTCRCTRPACARKAAACSGCSARCPPAWRTPIGRNCWATTRPRQRGSCWRSVWR